MTKGQITYWLDPNKTYHHKTQGEKSNYLFCQETKQQIEKDKTRVAEIQEKNGKIAVFTGEREEE